MLIFFKNASAHCSNSILIFILYTVIASIYINRYTYILSYHNNKYHFYILNVPNLISENNCLRNKNYLHMDIIRRGYRKSKWAGLN